MNHPDSRQLDDALDQRLLPADEAALARHLDACATCRDSLERRRAVRDAAAALPAALPVPDDLWSEVRATIAARQVVPFPPAVAPARPSRLRLVAAAVALVAVSSATTAILMRGTTSAPEGTAVVVLPAAWQATEAGWLESVGTLRAQFDAQRAQLDPATIAAVDRALATIDAAITEARVALQRDPANAAVSDLLASNYRQKVELLRRAAQLASET